MWTPLGRYFEKSPSSNIGVSAGVLTTANSVAYDEPFEVPRFPQNPLRLCQCRQRAGFRIVKIEEPRPSEELAREHAWLNRWYAMRRWCCSCLAEKM